MRWKSESVFGTEQSHLVLKLAICCCPTLFLADHQRGKTDWPTRLDQPTSKELNKLVSSTQHSNDCTICYNWVHRIKRSSIQGTLAIPSTRIRLSQQDWKRGSHLCLTPTWIVAVAAAWISLMIHTDSRQLYHNTEEVTPPLRWTASVVKCFVKVRELLWDLEGSLRKYHRFRFLFLQYLCSPKKFEKPR